MALLKVVAAALLFALCTGKPLVPSVKQHVQECIEKYESSGGCQIFIASPVLTNNVSDPSVFALPGVIIWDPLNQLVCFSSGIQCPHCRLPLKARYWKDGRNDKHDTPRELWDIDGKVLLVSRVYVCSSDHRIIAHDPLILESIPVPGTIPFLLSHKVGVTLRLNELIISHVIAGLTFSQIEQFIVQLHWNRHSKLASCYWEEIQKGQVNNQGKSANVPSYQEFNVSNFPSRRLVNLCFVGDYANNEQLYATRMSLHSAKQLSCDHTFKVAANIGIWIGTRWVQQYDTLFAVLNEQGLVVAWQLAKGCSFSKVKHTLLNLKKRLEKGNEKVESFCIDNCCQWRNLIKEIFGNHTEVKLDLFHAVQRISSQIPKHHPFRKQCVAALRLVFRHHDDLEKDRKRETPCSSEIMKNINLFEKQWGNAAHNSVKVLNKKACDEIDKLKKHITKGCLSAIPVGRGTHRNENLHKNLKKNLSKSRIGVQTATALLGTFFYVWNERMLQRNAKSTVVRPISAYESEFIRDKVETTKEIFGTGVSLREMETIFGDDNEQSRFIRISNQSTFYGFSQDEIVQNSAEFEDDEEIEDNTALLSSAQCQSAVNKAQALKTVYERLNAQCKAQSLVNPGRLLRLSKGFLSGIAKVREENPQLRDGEIRMKGHLKAFGMRQVTMPADGDCFFSSVSFQLSQILASGKNTDFAKRLETLGISASLSQREIAQTLRRLLVEEWIGQRRNEYEPFVSISGFSYELQAREFLTEGHFDSEIGNAMVLAVSNILQIPFIIFTTMENLPVVTSIPTTETFFEIPLYLAFTHAGPGHYDALVLHDSLPVDERPVEKKSYSTQPVSVSCRCGQGRGAGKKKEVCNSYSSGCKCFRAIQACENCGCNGCANPYGENTKEKVTEIGPSARKRRKHSIQVQMQTDKDYMTAKGEEIQKPSWSTLEMFLLEIVIDMLRERSESDEPSLEEIGQAFNEVSSVSSLNGNEILISKKTEGEVSKLVKKMEKEAALYKHLLFGELEET